MKGCKFFIALAAALLSLNMASGQGVHAKYIPYFGTLNPSKLALQITHNMKSDSEKVRAIHDWVATYIKYDLDREKKLEVKETSTKRTLRKRKGICTDYSTLFASLCFYAGVNCVVVNGYDKNIRTTIGNNFYVDEHSWNAVYIEGGWKLVDACWDAGYEIETSRTFKGFFVHLFSGGKKDDRRYNPHFVSDPKEKYYLRDGTFFSTDHMPLNPIWQLQPSKESIAKYAKDSSFYFRKYAPLEEGSYVNNSEETQRMSYMNSTELDRQISDGLYGYSFNHNNQLEAAVAYADIASIQLNKLNGLDTTGKAAICDTTTKLLNISLAHNDSMRILTQKQRSELMASSKAKNAILIKQNTKLIETTRNMAHFLSTSSGNSKRYSKQLGSQVKTRSDLLKNAVSNKSSFTKAVQGKHLKSDSIAYSISIRIWNDSIKREQRNVERIYKTVDSLSGVLIKHLDDYETCLGGVIGLDKYITDVRRNALDDMNYEVRRPKDSLIKVKYRNDSLLISKKDYLINDLFEELNKGAKADGALINAYKTKMQMEQQQKNFCGDIKALAEQYNNTVTDMSVQFSQMSGEEGHMASLLTMLNEELKNMATDTKEEQHTFETEKRTEQEYYNYRNKSIKNHMDFQKAEIGYVQHVVKDEKKGVSTYMHFILKMRKNKKKKS